MSGQSNGGGVIYRHGGNIARDATAYEYLRMKYLSFQVAVC